MQTRPVTKWSGFVRRGSRAPVQRCLMNRMMAASQEAGPARSGKDSRPATERSEKILDGVAEVLATYGYHGASLRMIADHVGMSHPGLLHHFPTKEALLDGVILRLESHAQSALDNVDDLSSGIDNFRRGLTDIWQPESHSMQLLAVLHTDIVSEDHPGRARMARLCLVHEHVLEQCFLKFAEQGLMDPKVDPAFASRTMLHQILGSAVRARTVRVLQRSPHDDHPARDLDRLLRCFLVQGKGRRDG